MRDAARSAKQNIREGYRKESVGQFINYLKISRGSVEELSGDIEDCFEDGLISQDAFNELAALYRSIDYLSGKNLSSLYKMEKNGTWKMPYNELRKKK